MTVRRTYLPVVGITRPDGVSNMHGEDVRQPTCMKTDKRRHTDKS